MDLFSEKIELPLEEANVTYYPCFLSKIEADELYKKLLKETPWGQDTIKVFGKVHEQPRLTALYGNNGQPYSYSNIKMEPEMFTLALSEIKKEIDKIAGVSFTTCLLNLYRDGKDSNGWHSDDEKELGQNPVIASLSLGTERVFKLRKKDDHKMNKKIILQHGSLLIMYGQTQHTWQHQIPKTARDIGSRINLTFRVVS